MKIVLKITQVDAEIYADTLMFIQGDTEVPPAWFWSLHWLIGRL